MRIFVFGSNEAGIHGAGAAKWAERNAGAIRGRGHGRHGMSYAIPTKDRNIKTLPLESIEYYIKVFLDFASSNKHLQFDLTPIGCGLAGYKQEQIKPLFENKPSNVHFTKEWTI